MLDCPICGKLCADDSEYQTHCEHEHQNQIQKSGMIFKKKIYPRPVGRVGM